MTTSSTVRDIHPEAFDQEVIQASHQHPVVVDFWAPWCGPCHQLSPILERVAARHADDVALVKVNVDEAPQVASRYGVQGIPAVKAFRDGKVVQEFVGVQPESAVESLFAGLAPSEADRLVAQAADEGEPSAREELLRRALERDVGHAGATVALAELLAARGERDEALTLLERVPEDEQAKRLRAKLRLSEAAEGTDLEELRAAAEGGDATAALRLGRALAAQEQHEEALRWLIDAVKTPAVREEARRSVLEIFDLLGDDHPVVHTWRPRLAAALF